MPEAEGNSTTQAAVAVGDSQTQTAELSKYIDEDGNLLEGWKEGLVPEDLRESSVYDKLPDLKSTFRQLGVLDKLVGRKGVVLPTDKSSPSEIEEFHKAIGVPAEIKGYKLQAPKGLEEFYDENQATEAKTIFKQIGLTQKQAETLWNFEAKRIAEGNKDLMANPMPIYQRILPLVMERQKVESEKVLRGKWGEAYDSRLHLANRVVNDFVNGDDRQSILERIGNDPLIADLFAEIGNRLSEHGDKTTGSEVVGPMTPAQAKSRINEIEAMPGFILADKDGKMMKNDGRIELFKELSEERDKLYRVMNINKK